MIISFNLIINTGDVLQYNLQYRLKEYIIINQRDVGFATIYVRSIFSRITHYSSVTKGVTLLYKGISIQ